MSFNSVHSDRRANKCFSVFLDTANLLLKSPTQIRLKLTVILIYVFLTAALLSPPTSPPVPCAVLPDCCVVTFNLTVQWFFNLAFKSCAVTCDEC